jgi:predicted nucleotidyltransferase
MLDKDEILSRLSQHQEELKQKFPINSIALYGSYVRGEQSIDSDIDLLIDFSEPVGMEIVDLAWELEAILGQKVDIVTYQAVKNRLFKFIKEDLVYA